MSGPRSQQRPGDASRWRRGRVVAMAVIGAGAVTGLVVPVMFRSEADRPPASVRTPVQTGRLQSEPELSFTGVTWRDYHGVLLPHATDDGPRDTTDDLAKGFARTPRGALLAAIHITVRASLRWGPKVFEATLNEQVIGPDAEALLISTRAGYEKSRGDRPAGEALGRGYVVLEGFRWQVYSPEFASLDLVSAGPGDSDMTVRAVTRVQLQWRDGDWRVLAPPAGMWAGTAAPVDTTDGYVRFPGGSG